MEGSAMTEPTGYTFAEPQALGCFVPHAKPRGRSLEVLEQAASWYGIDTSKLDEAAAKAILDAEANAFRRRWIVGMPEDPVMLGFDGSKSSDHVTAARVGEVLTPLGITECYAAADEAADELWRQAGVVPGEWNTWARRKRAQRLHRAYRQRMVARRRRRR
jgi:hypothetical protein